MPDQVPDARPDPDRPLADELVLAALERAARQRPGGVLPVPARTILEHLGAGSRSAAARVLRGRLRELLAEGALARSRRHGVEVFSLAPAGRARLRRARRAGQAPTLPESPQHRRWRGARTAAALEVERFRAHLGALLEEGALLLAAEPPPTSDAWLELAESLRDSARRVGSATHCLLEWPEPDESLADVDDLRAPGDTALPPTRLRRLRALRAGRRNTRLWRGRV